MPKIFMRSDEMQAPKVGETILARLTYATLGSVWKIVTRGGRVIAKARVQKDYSKDERFENVPLFGGREANTGKNVFGLVVEQTDEKETLY